MIEIPEDAHLESITVLERTYRLLGGIANEEIVKRFLAGASIEIYVCILDTNQIFSDLKYRIQSGYKTGLLEAAQVGTVRLVAAKHVREEVREHLEEAISKYNIDVVQALRTWEQEYIPHIAFIDAEDVPILSGEVKVLAKRDADDVPTAQLIEMLQPHVALSRDKDLAAFGTVRQDSAQIAVAYRIVAHRDQGILVIQASGTLILAVGAATIDLAISALYSLVRRVDRRLLVLLLIGGALALLALNVFPEPRNWLRDKAKKPLDIARQGIDNYVAMDTAASEARKMLADVQRPSSNTRQTAREYAAFVLIRAPGPLTVRAITVRMIDAGYRPRGKHPQQHVGYVLRTYPRLFEKVGTTLWRIRSR